MVEALVEHDYVAQESDELTIKKGDIIRDVIKKPGGWWEGVLNDKKGMFPDNFVKVLEKEHGVVYRTKKVRQCRAIFSYKQDHEDELSLSIGDIIDVFGEEEEGWWRGVLHGKEGVFPSNFVEELVSNKSKSKGSSREDLRDVYENENKTPNLPPKPRKTLCEVKYSYKAQNDDELSLKEGDVVTLVSKDGPDIGWWKGEINGQVGVFPDNFVVIIPHPDDKQAREDKKNARTSSASQYDPPPLKPSAIVSQRKSLEIKSDAEGKASPPVVSKKPSLPVKKSPTGSCGGGGGLFSGLLKKVADTVDGSVIGKIGKHEGKSEKSADANENAFDQVERNSLLQDVRATRAKAPGRRLPTIVFKEGEPGVLNGTHTENPHLDNITENATTTLASAEEDVAEVKPKVREWEKHKAPWLEEMKMNQAKRTSPGPEQAKIGKLTSSTDKSLSPDLDETRSSKTSPYERDSSSPMDMSKSMPSLGTKLKTPPNELEKSTNPLVLRNKPTVQQASVRPQTISSSHVSSNAATAAADGGAKPTNAAANPVVSKISPHLMQNSRTPSPIQKPDRTEFRGGGDSSSSGQDSTLSHKQYSELLERIQKLEATVERQNQVHQAAVDDLRNKLKREMEIRVSLQVELEKVAQSQVMHL